jgi:phosphoribosylanthranilate isomerase
VVDAGADLFGMIFAPARRQVTTERAREIVDAVRSARGSQSPLAVGVFVDADAEQINELIHFVGLDLVQLHGTEHPELIAKLDAPAVKAIRPAPNTSLAEVRRDLDRYADAECSPIAFLIDGFHPGLHGGTGARADWGIAADLAPEWPLILAGGLTPENIAEAIGVVGPIAVDVSGGVETDGVKDPAKIASFVAKARDGFAMAAGSGLNRGGD